MAPTGGPADTTGPKIEQTTPITGTTNYSKREFKFQFSEFVNRGSFQKELSIEPNLGIQYSIKWKRKTAYVTFDEALPDSTTIILTVGANTSDTRNNKMGAPIQLAVSTGDEIDESSIYGNIRNAVDGSAQTNVRVLLYRAPYNLEEPATYSAEPDTGGSFNFNYLRGGTYKAIAIDDRNRNKMWDSKTEHAIPFSTEFISIDKNAKDSLDVLYWFEPDTIKPKLQAVGLLSSQRLRLRFGEGVRFTPNTNISITDTLGKVLTTAFPLYISADDPFIANAYSLQELVADSTYKIKIQGITDAAGNEALNFEDLFIGSNQQDTVSQDILTHNAENGLFPSQALEVEFTRPIQNSDIIDSTVIIEGDVDFDKWPNITVQNNKLIIPPQEEWIDGIDYRFMIWNPKTRKRQAISPEIWQVSSFGGVEINVESQDSTAEYSLQLFDDNNVFSIDTTFSQSIVIEDMPAIKYDLIIYKDVDRNNRWDYGSITPYRKPEPYFIRKQLSVQQGFTSEILLHFN